MSKDFLTRRQCGIKIGGTPPGPNYDEFVTKEILTNHWGGGNIDLSKLAGYSASDFVVDDDIIKAVSWETIFSFSGTSSGDATKTMTQAFDTSKSFRISGIIKWNSIPWEQGRAISIYNTGAYIFQINVSDADKSTRYLCMLVTDATDSWIRFDTRNKVFSYGTDYDFYLYYNAEAKTLEGRIGTLLNETKTNVNIKVGSFLKLMLSGSPEWSNGDCSVTFSNFKIELLV